MEDGYGGIRRGQQGLRWFFVFVKWATLTLLWVHGALRRRVRVGRGGRRCVHCAGERGGENGGRVVDVGGRVRRVG